MAKKYFSILRGVTIASAMSGAEKQKVLEFINKIEGSLKLDAERLDR